MSWAAAGGVIVAIGAAFLLVIPAARRTGLGVWHPAIAWLVLQTVFFGVGSAILAIADDRPAPALDVAAAVLAFGLAVAASDRVAWRRRGSPERAAKPAEAPAGQVRWVPIVAMVGVGIIALVPTLAAVGIPALAVDITGARVAIGGLEVQVLRVALPAALVVGAVVAAIGGDRRVRIAVVVGLIAALVGELALASRYLAAELVAALVIGLALGGRPVPTRLLAGLAIVGAGLFVSIGVLRAYGQAAGHELDFAIDRSVNRVLLIQPRTLDAIQTAIPSEVPYYGGLTWVRRLAPIFGRDDVPNLGYWVYPRLFPDQTTPGYAAPGLLGEAWANFGPLGTGLFALVGVAAERFGALIARRRRDVVDVAAGAVAILFLARTHAIGLTGLGVLVVIVVAWRLLAGPLAGLPRDLARTLAWRT